MTLIEANVYIARAVALGIPELIDEAIENHKDEMRKRGRKVSQDYSYFWKGR